MLSVAEHFQSLPEAELRRIQIQLKIILKHSGKNFRQLLTAAYSGLSFSAADLELAMELIRSFGSRKRKQLSEAAQLRLRSVAWVVWPDENSCALVAEALPALLAQKSLVKERILYYHLRTLAPRERRSWSQWLGLLTIQPEAMYQEIGLLRSRTGTLPAPVRLPRFLDEAFTAEQLFWFSRQVLPFYATMLHLDKLSLSAEQRSYLLLFKQGYLRLRECIVPGAFSRFALIATSEEVPGKEDTIPWHTDQHLLFK
ncbi:MAG: hypothetical protein HS115_00390 [Spirochaetales bacterium]|nr:hypothetical protein [Spirochaetales bacterium]